MRIPVGKNSKLPRTTHKFGFGIRREDQYESETLRPSSTKKCYQNIYGCFQNLSIVRNALETFLYKSSFWYCWTTTRDQNTRSHNRSICLVLWILTIWNIKRMLSSDASLHVSNCYTIVSTARNQLWFTLELRPNSTQGMQRQVLSSTVQIPEWIHKSIDWTKLSYSSTSFS